MPAAAVTRRQKDRRTKVVFTRVTPEEHAAIHAAAARVHRDTSSWIRHIMLLALEHEAALPVVPGAP